MKPLPASIRTQINSNPDFHDDLGGCHEEDSVFHGGGGGCDDWSYSDGGGGSGNPYDISGNSFVYERRRTNETDDYEFLDEVRLNKIFGSGNWESQLVINIQSTTSLAEKTVRPFLSSKGAVSSKPV